MCVFLLGFLSPFGLIIFVSLVEKMSFFTKFEAQSLRRSLGVLTR